LHPETMKAVLGELKKCGGHPCTQWVAGISPKRRFTSPVTLPLGACPHHRDIQCNVVTSICSYGLMSKDKASEEVREMWAQKLLTKNLLIYYWPQKWHSVPS
jgi:hypothetical protein